MDAAGSGAAALIVRWLAPIRGRQVVVVCGKGNNGGDGFVVARRLRARGAVVQVFLTARRDEVEGDAAAALAGWRGRVEAIDAGPDPGALARALERADAVVDALLGTGLTGPARGQVAAAIEAINEAGRRGVPVFALDLPSGLGSDHGALLGPTVKATRTITFAGLKRSLLLHPAAAQAGPVDVVDIGVPAAEVARGITTWRLEAADVRRVLSPARGGRAQGPLRPSPDRGRIARQDRRRGARRARRAPERGRALHDRGPGLAAADRRRARARVHDRGAARDRRRHARARGAGARPRPGPTHGRGRARPRPLAAPGDAGAGPRPDRRGRAAPGGRRGRARRARRASRPLATRAGPARPHPAPGRDGAHAGRAHRRGAGRPARGHPELRARPPGGPGAEGRGHRDRRPRRARGGQSHRQSRHGEGRIGRRAHRHRGRAAGAGPRSGRRARGGLLSPRPGR